MSGKTRFGSSPAAWGQQSTLGATDFSLVNNQSTMPFAQALYGALNPSVPQSAEMEKDISSLRELFANSQEVGFRLMDEAVPLPTWFTRMLPLQPPTPTAEEPGILPAHTSFAPPLTLAN
jgi:hypothetical protein